MSEFSFRYLWYCVTNSLQRGEPPLNLKTFVASNAFDNSEFLLKWLKFTWLAWVVIANSLARIDASSVCPIPFNDTLITQPAFPTP